MPYKPKASKLPWVPDRTNRHTGSVERQESKKFYQTPAWKRTRAAYRREHPLCEECERNGRITQMYYVDHIQPIRMGGSELSWDNLQSLCKDCHHSKSGKEAALYKRNGEGYSKS